MQKRQEGRVVGVLAKTPFDAVDEVAQHTIAELRPTPGAGPYQRCEQNHLPVGRALLAPVQQVVDHDGAPRALPAQVPRPRQVQPARLLEECIEHLLIQRKVADAGPLTTGQAMPWQVTADHSIALAQCPLDHMPVKPHVVVIAMQQEHGGHGLWR
ncbi:hypothetical protein D3C81_1217850 [compost metagenome]